jgi:catechol 2,3-dioxygenase-like lactoylglutathione lyase family enzyme
MQLEGIHHVTAVSGNASRNVAFYTQVLGMRLTKKTVNQDDVSAYHLFYGDELGSPGTDLTFFEWPDIGYNRPGVGSISTIVLGVTGRDALNWWLQRASCFPSAIPRDSVSNLLTMPESWRAAPGTGARRQSRWQFTASTRFGSHCAISNRRLAF